VDIINGIVRIMASEDLVRISKPNVKKNVIVPVSIDAKRLNPIYTL
jgi:hypothetical protein